MRPCRAWERGPLRASRLARQVVAASLLTAGAFASALVHAADAPMAAFRPCIDPGNLPFANQKGEGFENKIAELFARELGVPVKSFAYPQRMNFVRNTLRFKLPDEDYPCDIMMSVPAGFDQVSATTPYYRSTYALVYARDGKLAGVKSADDLFALPPERRGKLRIGIYDKSPASAWLAKHGWLDQAKVYPIMSPDPESYPGELVEKELTQGTVDAAVVWGPIAGYYAKRAKAGDLVVVPLRSEPGVKFDYEIAMGVRYGEPDWKAKVEKLIVDNKTAITAILRDYNVPLIDASGNVMN